MIGVSGWYEGEYGAIQFHYDNVIGVNGLANLLLTEFGQDCMGVDIEISGNYLDGLDVEESLDKLADLLNSEEWPDFVEGDLV